MLFAIHCLDHPGATRAHCHPEISQLMCLGPKFRVSNPSLLHSHDHEGSEVFLGVLLS